LSKLIADRASFRSGSPSSDVSGFSSVNDIVNVSWETDRLNVVGEGDFSINPKKRVVVGELERGSIVRIHVDFSDVENDFSVLIVITVVVSSDLDLEGLRLISVSINTVSSTHDPVLVNDSSTATEITASKSIVHAHLDLPWPTVWDSYFSTDDSGLIRRDWGVSTIGELWGTGLSADVAKTGNNEK